MNGAQSETAILTQAHAYRHFGCGVVQSSPCAAFGQGAIADATHREFAMLWQPTAACAAAFHELFENDWNVRADVPFDNSREYDLSHYAWNEIPDLLDGPRTICLCAILVGSINPPVMRTTPRWNRMSAI